MNALAMGIYDDLDNQTQPILRIDPVSNNMIAFGGHMSGKTMFIKTLLVRLHETIDTDERRAIYILDFGGNLGQYRDLPLVSACFDSSNEENVRRVFRTVESRMEKNTKLLNSRQFLEVWESDEAEKPEHIMLIIDNVNSFLADERYESYHDLLIKLCREGLSKGLSVIFTAADLSGGVTRMMGSFSQRFALEGSADKYVDIFGQRVDEPMQVPGRGVAVIAGKPREFHFFLPFRSERDDLPMFTEALSGVETKNEKLTAFDGDLTNENLGDFIAADYDGSIPYNFPIVGLDYYDHMPAYINMKEMHAVAIYGKKKFGKTNLLRRIIRSINASSPGYRIVFFDDGRKQLEAVYDEVKSVSVYLTSLDEMNNFLDENGYAAKMERGMINKDFVEKQNPPTVFVLQNKMLFQAAGAQLLKNVFPKLTAVAEEKQYWFIYSDVRKIGNNDRDAESSLNNSIAAAFLLDNIAEFVGDRGSRSVFGEMDPKELKNEYARCELGDGYFYDIESDELKKIKFIKED